MKTIMGGLALLGLGMCTGIYTEREVNREKYIKANLETNAPFLGKTSDIQYRDTDGDGKLETIKAFEYLGQRFHFKVIIKDGLYELNPIKE